MIIILGIQGDEQTIHGVILNHLEGNKANAIEIN